MWSGYADCYASWWMVSRHICCRAITHTAHRGITQLALQLHSLQRLPDAKNTEENA